MVRLLPRQIVKVACGASHVLALDSEGALFAWGGNQFGQLGLGDRRNRAEPVRVVALKKQHIVDIAAGDGFSAVLDDHGVVWTMGLNELVGARMTRIIIRVNVAPMRPGRSVFPPQCGKCPARRSRSHAANRMCWRSARRAKSSRGAVGSTGKWRSPRPSLTPPRRRSFH